MSSNQGYSPESNEKHNTSGPAVEATRSNHSTCTSGSSGASPAKDSTAGPGSYSTLDHVPLTSYDDGEAKGEYDDASLDRYLADGWTEPSTSGPTLCEEQAALVELIANGRNTFYTGSAGCGKSTVLKAFVERLRNTGKTVYIVAPTGRAALDINGSTTWTYAGLTPAHMQRPLGVLQQAAKERGFVRKRLRSTDVLVIDEISMVENHFLERLNHIMKAARNCHSRAFGGAQIVVTGDFCQLPPVKPFNYCYLCGVKLRNEDDTTYTCAQHGLFLDTDKWAFKSKAWEECDFTHFNLTTIHRQRDPEFIRILERCRLAKPLSGADQELLLQHECDTENAVWLLPTRKKVKKHNDYKFSQLTTPKHTFNSHDNFQREKKHFNLKHLAELDSDGHLFASEEHRLEPMIELKKGMQVVLLVNLDLSKGLVNGSQGIIVDFVAQAGQRTPEQTGEHKVYTAEQMDRFISRNEKYKVWPVVQFANRGEHIIFAHCAVNELGDFKPYSLLSRTQIPLMAAWAMTVHKSQGMTLDRVSVDLSDSFEAGQEYVALSRARSLDGLKVLGLGNLARGANQQVREFLRDKLGVF